MANLTTVVTLGSWFKGHSKYMFPSCVLFRFADIDDLLWQAPCERVAQSHTMYTGSWQQRKRCFTISHHFNCYIWLFQG